MSEINQINVKMLFKMMGNKNAREVIKILDIENALNYHQIMKHLGISQGLPAYYLKKMERLGVLRHDQESHRWYLSRAGLKLVRIVKTFEKFCTTYDMSDVDSDGKVKIFIEVVDRKQ